MEDVKMSEKLKSTVENAIDTRELADLNREKAAEIERSEIYLSAGEPPMV